LDIYRTVHYTVVQILLAEICVGYGLLVFILDHPDLHLFNLLLLHENVGVKYRYFEIY